MEDLKPQWRRLTDRHSCGIILAAYLEDVGVDPIDFNDPVSPDEAAARLMPLYLRRRVASLRKGCW